MVFGKSLSERSESNRWRADGIRVEFLLRIHNVGHIEEIEKFFMTELQCEPEQFKGRIIFMSMYNDIVLGERGKTEKCVKNCITVANYACKFLSGHWSCWGPGLEKKWYGTYPAKWNGEWDKTAEVMMLYLHSESCHPIFRATSALERGEVRSKGKGNKSIHFNGSDEHIELILRTVISVNQLRIYGAVADLSEFQGNLMQTNIWKQWKSLQNFQLMILTPTQSCRETCCKIMNVNSATSWRSDIIQTVLRCWFEDCFKRTILHHTWWRRSRRNECMSKVHVQNPEREGGFSETRKSARSWMWRSVFIKNVTVFRDGTASWVRIVNGIHKYVTQTSETISLEKAEHIVTRKTCCKSKPTTKACCDTVSHFYSSSWKKMDRHQSRKIPWRVFCSVKSHDQITATWSINSSRRWWSSTIWRYHGRIQGKVRWCFAMVNWRLKIFSGKGGLPKKRFQYCLNPNSSKHFLHFRAIQGHAGGNLVDPALQDNALLPEDFTEYTYHIWNKSETHSINQRWVDPRRKKSQKEKAICVFHYSEPDGRRSKYGRNSMRLGQAKDRSTQNTWRPEDEGGVVPQSLPISKVASCKTEAELTKWTTGSTWSSSKKNPWTTKAYRGVTGKPAAATSTVEYQAYLILQSNNRTRIAEKQSKSWFSSSRATRTRSLSYRTWTRLKKLMNSAKSRRSWSPIWTIRRSSSFARPLPKNKCPDFAWDWEIGIVHCTWGRCLQSSKRTKELDKTTSNQLQALLSKRTPFAMPNMDLLSGNECTARLRKCCKKLVNPSMEDINPYLKDGAKTTNTEILCHSSGGTRSKFLNMTRLPWKTIHTSQENLKEFQNTKHWVLRLNVNGAQQPPNQRLDFAQAKRECQRLHDEHVKKTQQEHRPINPGDQQSRQRRGQAFEGIDEHDYRVDPRTGWRFKSSESQGNLSHSSSSTNWDRNNWTTSSWKSWHSSRF